MIRKEKQLRDIIAYFSPKQSLQIVKAMRQQLTKKNSDVRNSLTHYP